MDEIDLNADPVDDQNWPNIVPYVPARDDIPFPEGWGSEPTERDQAAINAGNAPEVS